MDQWLQGVADWLKAQPIHETLAGKEWIVPAVQTVHIICVAIVLTAALLIALRGMELAGTHWSLARWSRRFRVSTTTALWVLLATGIIMVVAEPERELMNWIFRAKMLTVIVTILIAGMMGRRLRATRGNQPVGAGVRLVAILVLLLWFGVATAGRWIAYAG